MKEKVNFEQLAAELDQIKHNTWNKVGQEDADYIRKVIRYQRYCEWSGRLLLVTVLVHPLLWLLGVLLLAIAKILDNMEIGHNVMHGQYDWMNDRYINSSTYEWDIACDGESWHRVHNYEHHTYTNIIGKDRDYGYGLLRLSDDFKWRVKNLWQFLTYLNLSLLFQWGVSYHELAAERVLFGKQKQGRESRVSRSRLVRRFISKGGRQVVKDYVLFPVLAWPVFLWVLGGNLLANALRNIWTSTIIFCGHFTQEAETFSQQECEGETKGQWYYRQALGSSNISGKPWFHLLSGHLSFQVEHHLFPYLPSSRYQEVAPQVQAVLKRHNIPYHSAGFWRQYTSVLRRILRYSLP